MDSFEKDLQTMLELARASDQDALGNLLARYEPELRRISRGLAASPLRSIVGASDAVQNSYLDIIAELRRPDFPDDMTEEEFLRFIRRICRNNVKDLHRHHRAKKRDVSRQNYISEMKATMAGDTFEPTGNQATADSRVANSERVRLLRQLIQRELAPRQAQAVELHKLDGLTLREVAARLDCNETAAGSLVRHGLQKLRQANSREELRKLFQSVVGNRTPQDDS